MPDVEESSQGKTATKETNNSFWSCLVESLQSLQTEFVVVVEYDYISLGQNKSSHSTEEDRGAIQFLNTQSSSRITTMSSTKASRKHGHHSFGVSRDP